MNKMVKRFLIVMLSAFVFAGVISTPVLATETESEIIEETVIEEEGAETEEEVQEETAEPTDEITEPDEQPEPAEEPEIETEPAEEPVGKGGEIVIDEPILDEIDIGSVIREIDLGPGTRILAEGDEDDEGEGGGSDEVTIGANKTVTDTDGDGIYELALSVKATSSSDETTEADRSNIVLVIDVSGSMDFPDTRQVYTYDARTYNENTHYYGTTNTGSYQRVYYRNNRWRTQNTNNGQQYNGTVYTAISTRLDSTKAAAKDVVDQLLAYNENEYGVDDMIEITVVKFANRTANTQQGYNGTETIIQDSKDAAAIKSAIDALVAGGGTHWRAALERAKVEADYFNTNDGSGEKTSVIFLTDGFPTMYGTGSDGGAENNENISRSFLDAIGPARTIKSSGYDLYTIFAYGSDTVTYGNTSGTYNTGSHTGFEFLRGLVNYAHGTGNIVNYGATTITNSNCFNAKSTADLIDAFNSIIENITNQVGYAGVNLSDGVSLGATSTSVAVNGAAKEESMRYTVLTPDGKTYYTVHINSDGSAVFSIYDETGTEVVATLTDSAAETVNTTITNEDGTTTITSKLYSVTNGTGDDAVTYEMAPATINPDTGMVQWNLAGLGILKSGYTYQVAFDVWPNQLAYDIAADLNNGLYTSVDAALDAYGVTDADERTHIKDALVHNADGSYSIYTNYEQAIDYYPATSETDEEGNVSWSYGKKQTQELPHPDPLPLAGSLLPMNKIWESGLSQNELDELLWEDGVVGGTPTKYSITLYVWKADTEAELDEKINAGITDTNKPYITTVLGWDEEAQAYVWDKDVAVAPGMMVNIAEAEELGFDITDTSRIRKFTNDSGVEFTYYVIESGHYYYVTEDGSDLHFELETDLYHPMVVDGTLYNVFFGEGDKVEAMDPMFAVVATNTLKGGLNIHKIVSTTEIAVEGNEIKNVTEPVDEDGIETVTDEFTFEIKIWKVDDEGNKSAVYTYDDQIDKERNQTISGSIGWRVFSEPSLDEETGEIVYGANERGAILTADSQYADLAGGIFATIANNETTIILTMPANGEVRLVNLPAGTQYTVREIEDEEESYKFAAIESTVISSNEGGDEEPGDDDNEVISEATVTAENTVSGKISGNTANVETFYNWASAFYVYHSSDATIEKISFADTRVKGTYNAEKGAYTYEFDIVAEVKNSNATVSDFLYGGYYSAYAGTTLTDKQITELTYTKKDDGTFWYDNSAADEEYDYDYIKSSNMGAWKFADGYETNGFKMNPETDGVYYLKEVKNGYIRPYLHYTYGTATYIAQAMWLISDIDDANYTQTGFIIDDGTETAKVVASLTVKTANGGSTVKLTPEQVFRTKGVLKGYLTYVTATKYLVANKTYTTKQYWVTKDGLTVEGVTTRTISIGTKKVNGENKLTATDVDGLSVVSE